MGSNRTTRDRRRFLCVGGSALAAAAVWRASPTLAAEPPAGRAFHPLYPTQEPDLAREMVGVSHGNIARVRELVDARPSLARAAWDWGFGDWETALGAASHTGNRDIAEYLIAKGARPTLFSAAMLGQLDVVKAFVAASPGVQRIHGPHGITLLAHARAGKERAEAVTKFLAALGDADVRPTLVALDEKQVAALAGTYAFGPDASERIEIAPNPTSPTAPPKVPGGEIGFTRAGQARRQLFHLGDSAFYPSGALAVRIRFAVVEGRAARLTIHDPEAVLTAERIG